MARYLDTLNRVERLPAPLFVPANAELGEDIRPLVRINCGKVLEIMELILRICGAPHCFEDVLKAVFDEYHLAMGWNPYVLVGSTIRSYLSHLPDAGRVCAIFEDNRLVWASARP